MRPPKKTEGLMCSCENKQKWGDRYDTGDFIYSDCTCTVYDTQLWRLTKLMDLDFKFMTINATEKVRKLFAYKGESNETH